MTSIAGSFTVSANSAIARITGSPLPVVGTITMDFTSSSFSGEILLKKRRINAASTATWKSCAYQTSDATTDVAAGTVITGDKTAYIRLDGEELGYISQNYTSGSILVEWTWSAG